MTLQVTQDKKELHPSNRQVITAIARARQGRASLKVDFTECFSLTYNETSVVRCSVGYTGVGDKTILEAPWSVQRSRWNCPPSERWPSASCLVTVTSSRQTVTCQELRCKRPRPALCGKRTSWATIKEVADKTILQHQMVGVSC